jgi:hypothetical protein
MKTNNMKTFSKILFFFFSTLFFLNGNSQGIKSFCAYDNLNSKYELNLNEDSKSLTYKKYNSSGSLLQTLNGTYVMRDEGVYGPTFKIIASINGNTLKWLVIRDGFGNIQELRDESAGRVWSKCASGLSGNSTSTGLSAPLISYERTQKEKEEDYKKHLEEEKIQKEKRDKYWEAIANNGKLERIYNQKKEDYNLFVSKTLSKNNAIDSSLLLNEKIKIDKFIFLFKQNKEKRNFKVNDLEIAEQDFPEEMNWEDAVKACLSLGDGWHLPLISELNIIKKYQVNLSSNNYYWGSSETFEPETGFNSSGQSYEKPQNESRALAMYYGFLKNGSEDINDPQIRGYKNKVRAVWSYDATLAGVKAIKNELDNPFEIANLKIAHRDFPDKMTWRDAKIACSNLGDGWYLPSKDELNILFENKNKVPNITNDDYWSSTEYSSSSNLYGVRAWNQFFNDGQMINSIIDNKKKVRAIWSKNVAADVKNRREDELNYAKRRRQIAINDSILSSKSIIIGKIEVYKKELIFPNQFRGMNFMQAEKACLELGDNWRLPTIDELKKIAKDKNNNERVVRDCFIWTSSEGKNSDEILMLNPYSGKVYSAKKVEGGVVRPVRYYEPTPEELLQSESVNEIIGSPFKIGNLEIASKDFPKRLIWEDAIKACSDLGSGWRLPNSAELVLLQKNKKKIGGFADGSYWSSTDTEAGKPIVIDGIQGARGLTFNDGNHAYYSKADDCNVRAVRNN